MHARNLTAIFSCKTVSYVDTSEMIYEMHEYIVPNFIVYLNVQIKFLREMNELWTYTSPFNIHSVWNIVCWLNYGIKFYTEMKGSYLYNNLYVHDPLFKWILKPYMNDCPTFINSSTIHIYTYIRRYIWYKFSFRLPDKVGNSCYHWRIQK